MTSHLRSVVASVAVATVTVNESESESVAVATVSESESEVVVRDDTNVCVHACVVVQRALLSRYTYKKEQHHT